MPSLLTNLLIGASGLTIVGSAVFGGYFLLKDNNVTILELLNKNKKKLLTNQTEDNDAWNKNWGSYIDENSVTSAGSAKTPKNTDIWELSDWASQKSSRTNAPKTFKDKCTSLAKEKVDSENNPNYKRVESYCTK